MSRDRTARARIRELLATSGPLVDPSGYATGLLKDAIAYSGSSVAFIQLIAAMDRDGEIEREIRGKRTYRITGVGVPVGVHGVPTTGSAVPAAAPVPAATTRVSATVAGQPTFELDYTKLAQALVRELWMVATAAAGAPAAERDHDTAQDRLTAERDEYARRIEVARSKLDELLGVPVSSE